MMHSARFWILMVAFQLVFGFIVFSLTRQYYADSQGQSAHTAAPPPSAARQAAPARPASGVGNDLENLISTFPGPTLTTDPSALSRQADRFFVEQQYGQAARLYEQALAAGSQDVDDYNSLGLTLHYLGRSDEALRLLEQGVTLSPSYQRIWLTLGYVNGKLGNLEAARAALTTAVQMDPASDVGQSAAEMLDSLP